MVDDIFFGPNIPEKEENAEDKSDEFKNLNIDASIFNEKSLNLLSIRDLRNMGRKFGVPSPTSRSKSDLVAYILKIVYGEVEAPPNKASLGRPTTSREFNLQRYIEKIRRNTAMPEKLSQVRLYPDYGDMVASSEPAGYSSLSDKIETRVLCEQGGKFYLRSCVYVESPDDILVSGAMMKKFKLEVMDVLEIIKCKNLFKIVTINGIRVKDKFLKLKVSNEPVLSGTNKVFYMCTKEETEKTIDNLIETCQKHDVEVMLFSKSEKVGKNIHQVLYSEKDDSSVIYKKFIELLGQCEMVASECGDIMILVENMSDVDAAISSFDIDVCLRIRNHINDEIQKLTSLGNCCVMLSGEY